MAKRSGCSGCGCISGIIGLIVVILLVGGVVFSFFTTIEDVGIADTEGIVVQFDSEKYTQETTFRSLGMENWTLADLTKWIATSGDYQPKEKSEKESFIDKIIKKILS